MKKFFNSKSFSNTLGTFLIALAGIISNSTCLFFAGEPEAPQSLIK